MSAESETVAFAEGEGVGEAAGRAAERADVLAYLARKRANAQLLAARSPDFADQAAWIVRQINVFSDDLRGGLHECESLVGQAILSGPTASLLEARSDGAA